MPEVVTPIDRAGQERSGVGFSLRQTHGDEPSWQTAHSLLQAMVRGSRNRCPACGVARLFPTFLKPVDQCAVCGEDWTHQCADDFPAYIAILLAGHVLVPAVILVDTQVDLPTWSYFAFWLPLAALLVMALLQPAKGGVIAFQWWFGLLGFAQRGKARAARPPVVIACNDQTAPSDEPLVLDAAEFIAVRALYGWTTFNLMVTRAQARELLEAPTGVAIALAPRGDLLRFDGDATLYYRWTDRGGATRSEYLDAESARIALRRMLDTKE